MEEKNKKESVQEKVPFQKSSISKLTMLIAILAFIVVFLLGIIAAPYVKEFGKELFPDLPIWGEETQEEDANNDEETLQEEENTTEGENVVSTTETITGEVITTEVPNGWSVVEYMDGNGTDMLVGGGTTYTGLTALEIVNPDNEVVFRMKAIDGIGFAGCGDYAIFSDDNPSYYQEQVNANTETGVTMAEHDYTNTAYSEFEWLGTTMRRIGSTYYYDTEEGNNYFEPPCVPSLITLEGLYFISSGGYTGEAYSYGLTNLAASSEYETVDQILESMEVI